MGHYRRRSSMAEHGFRKAGVVGSTPTVGYSTRGRIDLRGVARRFSAAGPRSLSTVHGLPTAPADRATPEIQTPAARMNNAAVVTDRRFGAARRVVGSRVASERDAVVGIGGSRCVAQRRALWLSTRMRAAARRASGARRRYAGGRQVGARLQYEKLKVFSKSACTRRFVSRKIVMRDR